MMTENKIRRGRDVIRHGLIERVDALKGRLPRDYKKRLIVLHPEYDSIAGGGLITNVVTKRSLDIVVIEILERIAADYQAELAQTQPPTPPNQAA